MVVGHSDDVDAADAIAIAVDQCRDQLDGLAPQAGFLVAAFDKLDSSSPWTSLQHSQRLLPGRAQAAFANPSSRAAHPC
jgi:hypothetical protein